MTPGASPLPTEQIARVAQELRTLTEVRNLSERLYHAHTETSDARQRLDHFDRVIASTHRHADAEMGDAKAASTHPSHQIGVVIPTRQHATEHAERTHARFEHMLATVYTEPQHVRRVFHAVAEEHGLTAAVTELREHPTRFGQLRPSLNEGQALHSTPLPPDVIETLVRHARADAYAQQNVGLAVQVEDYQSRASALRHVLQATYASPTEAQHQVAASVYTHGVAETVRRLQEQPTAFGALRVESLRAVAHGRAIDPRESARTAAMHANAYYGTPHPVAAVRADAWNAWVTARYREGRARADLHRLPPRRILERRIAGALQRMPPHEITQLRQMLTRPHAAMAERLMARAKAFIRGEEHER